MDSQRILRCPTLDRPCQERTMARIAVAKRIAKISKKHVEHVCSVLGWNLSKLQVSPVIYRFLMVFVFAAMPRNAKRRKTNHSGACLCSRSCCVYTHTSTDIPTNTGFMSLSCFVLMQMLALPWICKQPLMEHNAKHRMSIWFIPTHKRGPKVKRVAWSACQDLLEKDKSVASRASWKLAWKHQERSIQSILETYL